MESGGGRMRVPAVVSAWMRSAVYQSASAISSPSTVMPVLAAVARKPSISDWGNGHGWEPR